MFEIAPGLGIGYEFSDALSVFGGIHKGFASSGLGSDVDNVESINYEFGARYAKGNFAAEAIGFFNDYFNLIGKCTLSSGCEGAEDGDQFNGGDVDDFGLELALTTTSQMH